MERITVSIKPEQLDLIDELSGDGGPCESRSESMRFVIDEYERADDLELEMKSLHQKHRTEIEDLEDEITSLENRLEESRRREIARDKTKQEIDVLREELQEQQDLENAPFFYRWWKWYQSR